MQYTPELTSRQIEENHDLLVERRDFYRQKGLDFLRSRDFILEKAGPLNGNILDIGSGKGIMALALARAGHSFVSVDRNEEMLKITALNLAYEDLLSRAELHVMDAYSLEFEDGSFGAVFMVDALHHMDNIAGVFSEAGRVLSPGGKFVLADFNRRGMEIVEHVHGSEGRRHESSSLGRDEAEDWLARKGYRIQKYDHDCHWVLIAEKTGKP